MNGGGVFSALIFVVGILIAFAVMFGFFLIVPFFIFLAGLVLMLVSDRKRGQSDDGGAESVQSTETVKTVETTTEVRGAKH